VPTETHQANVLPYFGSPPVGVYCGGSRDYGFLIIPAF
jgi:hypothetical protein